jgi:hypothetical protein
LTPFLRKRQLLRFEGLQTGRRIDEDLEELFGMLLGDFFDLDATLVADHEDDAL